MKIVAYLEILLGVIIMLIAGWFISGIWFCPGRSVDCAQWAKVGAYLAAPSGLLILGAGIWLLNGRTWRSQIFMVLGIGWFAWWVYVG